MGCSSGAPRRRQSRLRSPPRGTPRTKGSRPNGACFAYALPSAVLEGLLAAPRETAAGAQAGNRNDLSGKAVCFTGEITSFFQGERITRAVAENLAARAGLKVLANVTRKLDILVVADPETISPKAKKARDNGTRIMAQAAFWKTIGVDVV